MKKISIQNMKDYMIASAIFAQGQPENFHKSLTLIEDLAEKGLEPMLADPKDIPDDALVCQVWQRAGGGYSYENGELEVLLGPFAKVYEEREWSRYGRFLNKAVAELTRAIGEEIYGYMAYCTSSSQGIIPMYVSALQGKPFIDGDCCGTAMEPHLDEVAAIPYRPVQVAISPYGETLILKDMPPVRASFVVENFHHMSGCWFIGLATALAPFGRYKRAMVTNQASRLIRVGEAVRNARKRGEDPVKAFVKTAPAYKLFEGEVEEFTLKKLKGRVQGFFYIRGSGEFKGQVFKVWYSMENRISWLDGEPRVTIPDITAIVDRRSCESLSVLDHDNVRIVDGMYNGRLVSVLGIAASRIWYELEGAIEAVNAQLKAYGFDVIHRPIKEVLSGSVPMIHKLD